jgi:hypothetical protein
MKWTFRPISDKSGKTHLATTKQLFLFDARTGQVHNLSAKSQSAPRVEVIADVNAAMRDRLIADRGALLLDVRPRELYIKDRGRAVNIPINELEERIGTLIPRNTNGTSRALRIIIDCQHLSSTVCEQAGRIAATKTRAYPDVQAR